MPSSKTPHHGTPRAVDLHNLQTSERLLPALGARPRVVMATDDIVALDLSPQARRAVPYLDGTRTVHELLEAIDVDNLFDVLDELEHEGVIAISRR